MPCETGCIYRITPKQIEERGLSPTMGESRFRIIVATSNSPVACEAPGQVDFAICTKLEATEKTCNRSPDYQEPKEEIIPSYT